MIQTLVSLLASSLNLGNGFKYFSIFDFATHTLLHN